jgi:hypothetical protein
MQLPIQLTSSHLVRLHPPWQQRRQVDPCLRRCNTSESVRGAQVPKPHRGRPLRVTRVLAHIEIRTGTTQIHSTTLREWATLRRRRHERRS